jgi:hypothetical protein
MSSFDDSQGQGVPGGQAVEMRRYQAGWNLALNQHVGDELFHPTTLLNFRQRPAYP